MLNENETLQMSMFSPLGYETPTADSFVASLDKNEVDSYTEYWQSIQPKNEIAHGAGSSRPAICHHRKSCA